MHAARHVVAAVRPRGHAAWLSTRAIRPSSLGSGADSLAPIRALSSTTKALAPGLLAGITKAVAGTVMKGLSAVTSRVLKSSSESARLGQYLHYNINYRVSKSPSMAMQCGRYCILGAPTELVQPPTTAAGAGTSAEPIKLTATFPVLFGRGGRLASTSTPGSGGPRKDNVAGLLQIHAILRPAQARVPDTDFKSASARALKAGGGPQKQLPGRAGARQANTAAQPSTAVAAGAGVAGLAGTSSALEPTGGVASLQPIVAQVGDESVTVAVRSQAVLAAVTGRQQEFATAAAAALKIARGERMQQRFERRKHQWESPPSVARADGAGALRESFRPMSSPPTAAAGSTPAPASLATATEDSLADDFRGVLGDAQMFVAERLEDMADEARCLGLAPAVAFDVSRAVFVSAATGAPLDLTRELGGVLFDNLGALADGAAMVLAASVSPGAAAGEHALAQAQLAAPLTAAAEAGGGAAAAAGGSPGGAAGATVPEPGGESPARAGAHVSRGEQPAATVKQPAPVDIGDFPKF